MQIYLNSKTEITQMVTSLTLSGEYRSCCRTLDFGIICSPTDPNIKAIAVSLGDTVQVSFRGKAMFAGVVWTKSKGTDASEIDFHCKDLGVYLVKNKASYRFTSITPEAVTAKVCADLGIATGELAVTGVPISRNFINATLYDIIMTSYTLANDRKYMCIFEGSKLSVIEKGIAECPPLKGGTGAADSLLTSSVSETLDQMVNRVQLYSDKDVLIKTYSEDEQVKLYGLLSEHLKASDAKTNYDLEATKLLKGIDRKITVTNMGSPDYITGKAVVVTEPFTGLSGRFYIDADQHNWKNGLYTNKLTLNFENMMDEKEGGSDGK